jgi:hypothetical protein
MRWRDRSSGIGRATRPGEASTSRRDAGAQRRDGSRGGWLCDSAAPRKTKLSRLDAIKDKNHRSSEGGRSPLKEFIEALKKRKGYTFHRLDKY